MLGTVHRDPAGKRRLWNVLEKNRPGAISLEVSPASVELRTKFIQRWLKLFKSRIGHLQKTKGIKPRQLMAYASLRGVYEYIKLPYEYRAALAYARENDVPLFLLDDSELAAAYLNRVETEILSTENMTLLAEMHSNSSLAEEVDREYKKARVNLFNQNAEPVFNRKNQEAWEARETKLAQKLRLLHQGLARRADKTTNGRELILSLIIAPEAVAHVPDTVHYRCTDCHMYIGGWEHLVEDRDNTSVYSRMKDLSPKRDLCHYPDD